MKTYYYFEKQPSIHPQFMVDDFGDEIMAVSEVTPDIDSFQVAMRIAYLEDTYKHIFDLAGRVLDWQNGHREE